MSTLTGSTAKQVAYVWFQTIGLEQVYEPEVTSDKVFVQQLEYTQVVLEQPLCDSLLPKLISGELRVKDAERFLKERGL